MLPLWSRRQYGLYENPLEFHCLTMLIELTYAARDAACYRRIVTCGYHLSPVLLLLSRVRRITNCRTEGYPLTLSCAQYKQAL